MLACWLIALLAAPAAAQQNFNAGVTISDSDAGTADLFVTDVSVLDGETCIGNGCTDDETFAGNTLLKLRAAQAKIEFDDNSAATAPDRDWRLVANDDGTSGQERFFLEDMTAGTVPFSILGAAPDNALWIDDIGRLGIGTALPVRKLHLMAGNFPALRLEQDGSTGLTPYIWDISGTSSYFAVRDITQGTVPFQIADGQDDYTMTLTNGRVAVGTLSAKAGLHVARQGANGTALLVNTEDFIHAVDPGDALVHVHSREGDAGMLIEEVSTTTTPRTLLDLQNNGRPEIVMGNTSTGGEWSFGAGTNFILKQGAVGTDSGVKTKLFEIDPAGNATLTGSLTTGGTTCGGGCDAVFTERAVIPAAEYHAAMWAQGYLPHVGPTPENAPFNVTEKLGGVLNALEHAHVYIEGQNTRIARLEAENAALADRLARVESRLETRPQTRPQTRPGGGD